MVTKPKITRDTLVYIVQNEQGATNVSFYSPDYPRERLIVRMSLSSFISDKTLSPELKAIASRSLWEDFIKITK